MAGKTGRMTFLIAVNGAAPGVGKSTLCGALDRWLIGLGLRVDHFREEEILTRPAFAPLAAEFTTTGEVRLATLLATTAEFLRDARTAGTEVVVADALVPFLPSLRAWGHGEQVVARFLDDLGAAFGPVRPVMVYLDGDPVTALRRAAEREGPDWLGWFVGKLAGYRTDPPVRDLDTAHAYLLREREVVLRLLRARPWDLVVVAGADQATPSQVERTVRAALSELAGTTGWTGATAGSA